jgi:signal transduction histidine kinase/CheY-like chemotaxis protein/HPt (histidine-containing phosphotransfer) domain-containing protein
MPARLRAWFDELTLRQRLLGLLGITVIALLAMLFWETSAGRSAQASYETVAADHQKLRSALRRLQRYYGYHLAVEWSQHVAIGRLTWEEALADLVQRRRETESDWAEVAARGAMAPGGAFADLPALRTPADAAVRRLAQSLAARDQSELLGFFAIELDVAASPLVEGLWAAGNALSQMEAADLAQARDRLQRHELNSYGVAFAACFLLFLAARVGLRELYRGIEGLTAMARRVSARDFTARPERIPRGELGELARAFATMQEALGQYAQELHERELEARAASQAKSMFLAAMSHEIRTPLIGVLGMLEVLGRSALLGEQRRQFDIVQQSAQSLLEIIGDILDYSKIEAGKVELAPETVAIRDLVSRAVSSFSALLDSKQLQVTQQVDARVAAAHVGDSVRLLQILRNFISNGIKFTAEGSVTVTVAVVAEEAGAQRLAFTVTDTGIGMTPEQLGRVFQPFTQADAGTTRRFGGTGLGLVICRRLADLMGARVAASSVPGQGTSMLLEVMLAIGDPRDIAAASAAQQPVVMRRKPTREQAEAEGSLLLLAEDHPVNREVLTGQLSLAGFVVDTAEDGARALERFTAGRYALLLTDLHMPGLDGFQLTSSIREFERAHGRPRTPIIALTADVVREHVERSLAEGMDDYLSKPVTIRQLVGKLRQWLPGLDWTAAPDVEPRPAAPGRDSPLEAAALDQLAGGDAEQVAQVLRFYCATTADDFQALQLAAGATRADVAHRIKGAALMVGAGEVAGIARELERRVRLTPGADCAGLIDQLRLAFARVTAHAQEFEHAAREPYPVPKARPGLRTPADL